MIKVKLPIYFEKIIKKYPAILSGRFNYKENHYRIIRIKKLILDYKLKKGKPKK